MNALASCLYEGVVVHKRLRPRAHAFAYRVFTLALDVDEIDEVARRLRFFSRNSRNLLSFRDRDLGPAGPGSVGEKARALLDSCGLGRFGARITLVCYPRLVGFVFNPLSVYFCRDAGGAVGAVVYEVTNTFGERRSYVIPAPPGAAGGPVTQSCAKELYVSPFTGRDGSYGFHCIPPGERIVVGVNFREGSTPVLKTHFRGTRQPLDDRTILGVVARHPLMTLKVLGAIHLEAARLWIKGVPLVDRHTSPAFSYTLVDAKLGRSRHA